MIMLKRRMIPKKKQSVSFVESCAMLEEMEKCFFLDDESQMMLSTLTKNFEDLQIKNKKQESVIHASYALCMFFEMKKVYFICNASFFQPMESVY